MVERAIRFEMTTCPGSLGTRTFVEKVSLDIRDGICVDSVVSHRRPNILDPPVKGELTSGALVECKIRCFDTTGDEVLQMPVYPLFESALDRADTREQDSNVGGHLSATTACSKDNREGNDHG
jgi:hypothetical protein